MNLKSQLIRHVAFPMMEYIKHNRIRKNLQELQMHEHQDPELFQRERIQKLNRLVKYSIEHVPAYQKYTAILSIVDKDPVQALHSLPVLTKKKFRQQRDHFLSDEVDVRQLILNRSGGSTGEPVMFYMDRYTVEYSEAARWRGLSWWDIHIGDPCVMVWGSPIELSQQQLRSYRFKERLLKNRTVIPAFQLDKQKIDQYIKMLHRLKPKYIYGWPSTLELFAKLILQSGQSLHLSLKGIVSTAEMLLPEQRQLFSTVFNCPVINEYGAREGGILAYECPYGNLHATVDNSWIEVVDRETMQPVPAGKPGMLVVTDLNNYAMPRLRYQLGDVVSLVEEPCSCGRKLPLFKTIEGREDDTFVTSSGVYVNGQYFTNIARTLGSIEQFQIRQVTPMKIILSLTVHPHLLEADITEFCRAIRAHMGNVEIEVHKVSQIEPAASGKRRVAIREFPLS